MGIGLFGQKPVRVRFGTGHSRAEVLLQRGIEYGRSGARRLQLDVARPAEGSGPFPLLLVFPGNGWGYFFWFNRRACRGEILEAASRGYVAAAIDYRPAIGEGFAAGLRDAHRAYEWLLERAATLDADPGRIALTGFSSGGQLALLLGLDAARGNRGTRCPVRAIVTTAAPADMSAFAARPLLGAAVRFVFRGGGQDLSRRYKQASPAANIRRGMPPLLLLHGTHDRFVPVEQSLILDRELERAGIWHELVLVAKGGHRDRWRDPAVWDFLARALDEERNRRFLDMAGRRSRIMGRGKV